jgi:hypothetical protein
MVYKAYMIFLLTTLTKELMFCVLQMRSPENKAFQKCKKAVTSVILFFLKGYFFKNFEKTTHNSYLACTTTPVQIPATKERKEGQGTNQVS